MEPPYSVWADWLSKFHTAPEWIQALWLVSVPATMLGMTWLVMRTAREIAVLLAQRPRAEAWQGHSICPIYRTADGRWMLSARGVMRELKSEEAEEQGGGFRVRSGRLELLPGATLPVITGTGPVMTGCGLGEPMMGCAGDDKAAREAKTDITGTRPGMLPAPG
jgi:hypothetical protein